MRRKILTVVFFLALAAGFGVSFFEAGPGANVQRVFAINYDIFDKGTHKEYQVQVLFFVKPKPTTAEDLVKTGLTAAVKNFGGSEIITGWAYYQDKILDLPGGVTSWAYDPETKKIEPFL